MVYGPIAALLVELFPARIRYTAMSLPYHIGNGWFGGFLPTIAFAMVAATGDIYAGLWYPVGVAVLTLVVGLLFLPETFRRKIDHEGESPSDAGGRASSGWSTCGTLGPVTLAVEPPEQLPALAEADQQQRADAADQQRERERLRGAVVGLADHQPDHRRAEHAEEGLDASSPRRRSCANGCIAIEPKLAPRKPSSARLVAISGRNQPRLSGR